MKVKSITWIRRLSKNQLIQNILWLLFDKILIILLQFLVGVKIANYYGAAEYGIYSYSVALLSFSPILLELTNDRITKKYFENENYLSVIESINTFKGIGSIIVLGIVIFWGIALDIDKKMWLMLIILSIDSIFMNCVLGIKSYFEYKLESKIVVKIDAQIKIGYYIIQYIGILLNYSLFIIIAIRVLGSFVRIVMMVKCFEKEYIEKLKIKCDLKIILKIIKESRYLWLATISYILYAQLDKIMIGRMINIEEVGIYNIATQLMGFMLVPIDAIRVSFYSILWKKYRVDYMEYIKEYKRITLYLTQFYIFMSICSYWILPKIFNFVYSSQYNGAIIIFNYLLIGIVIRGNETFQYTHYTFKEITKLLLYKQICGLIFNIGLNYVFILSMGAKGAALATSLTLLFTRFIFDGIFSQTRETFKIQLRAFNFFYLFRKEIK